jgi:predicted lipoprotein with Yx(FWY)xxD motif
MALAVAALIALAGCAAMAPAPARVDNGVLVGSNGMTLYTFDKDSTGKSNCSGGCLASWPAFTAGNASLAGGDFSIVVRDDGTQQWAFQGKPLYFFAGDAKPGEINGDNKGGVWHALRSAPKKAERTDRAGSPAGYGYSY